MLSNMAKMINGQITSIDEGIVADIESLISRVYSEFEGFDEPHDEILDIADRVTKYLDTYKLDDTE